MFKNDEPRKPKCQADEWPPAYFLPENYAQNLPVQGQLVRWVPGAENQGTGQIWKGFCSSEDGGAGNGQLNALGKVNDKLVKLKGNPHNSITVQGGTTTTYLEYEADFTRAVATLAFDWTGVNNGIPPDALGDPGYAILTEDKWYNGPWIPAADKAQRPQYRLVPSDASFNAAPRKRSSNGDEGLQRLAPLADGGFALRGTNSSRRLTDEERRPIKEELQRDVNVVECDDPSCGKEIKAFGGSGMVIPVAVATTLATVPSTNLDARPTEVRGEPRWTAAYTDAERAETTVEVPVETGRHRHHRHHRSVYARSKFSHAENQ
ncbi:glycoside hydrolase family 18 protein [Colletotrichum tofieldiae]|nr:glycoside hydrolase family 18 protein [Colletotrichum tofieldiae]